MELLTAYRHLKSGEALQWAKCKMFISKAVIIPELAVLCTTVPNSCNKDKKPIVQITKTRLFEVLVEAREASAK